MCSIPCSSGDCLVPVLFHVSGSIDNQLQCFIVYIQCLAAGTDVFILAVLLHLELKSYQLTVTHRDLSYSNAASYCSGAPDPDGNPANARDRKELICGACSAHKAGSKCLQHGTEFIEWKCQYCCGIASFFCFGTTHMCTACHERWQRKPGCLQASKHLCTPATCPLHIHHPDHGLEHCLGCALCRTHDG